MSRGANGFRGHRLAAAYFVLQGLAVAAWWVLLFLHPPVRAWFLPYGSPERDLLAFWLPDLALVAVGSLLAGLFRFLGNPWGPPLCWLVAGGVDYATAYCLAWSLASGEAWLGFALMAPAALVSTAFALESVARGLPLFRKARSAGAVWNVIKTLLQIVVFWSFFLGLVPWLIVRLEARLGVPGFGFPGQAALGWVLFLLCSALGIASGLVMALAGQGTPLPMDSPRRLVLRGPYAYVRNPMAMAGLGQGFSVAVVLGSWSVLAYALLGTYLWNCVVRPVEEDDLERHFGAEFVRYRQEVRCWLPRRTPFLG